MCYVSSLITTAFKCRYVDENVDTLVVRSFPYYVVDTKILFHPTSWSDLVHMQLHQEGQESLTFCKVDTVLVYKMLLYFP